MSTQVKPIKVFYSYAHKDEGLRRELDAALAVLRRNGVIQDWSDRSILPGGNWTEEIDDKLASADLVLLLISSDFVQSEYCWGVELQAALARHQAGKARVVPILLRPVYWKGAPFAKLQALPPDGKPVTEWEPRDRGWATVAEGIDDLASELMRQLPRQQATPRRARWPRPLMHLVGREAEVRAVREKLAADACLLTLNGPAGVGKSHLALEVGADPDVMGAFPDGIYRIDLSPMQAPELLGSSIARELGVQETGDVPGTERLAEFIGDKRMLLLLDGFERALPSKNVARDLLQACPGLSLLVTSRTRLNIPGESVIQINPLAVPVLDPPQSLQTLIANPSVKLFTESARAVRSTFTLTPEDAQAVAQLCVKVSGLPLAIYLLASDITMLSPQGMLNHLQILVEPLNAVIQTSVDLLDKAASTLFAQLSAFAGGFTLADAEAICGNPDLGIDVLPGLKTLLNASLVLVRTVNESYRYFLLEPVREHAIRRLTETGEQNEVWRRHAKHFRMLLESAEPNIEGPDQEKWLSRLYPEQDNIRAMLERCATGSVDIEEGLRLAGAHAPLWYVRGQFTEGRRWLQRLLTAGVIVRAPVRAKALNWTGMLAYHQDDYDEARQLLDEGLSLFEQLPEDPAVTALLNELGFVSKVEGRAKSLNGLGFVAKEVGDYEESVQQYRESLRLYRALDDEWGIVWTATDLALALLYVDDSAEAVELLQESAERQRRRPVRGRTGAALTTLHLGYATLAQGDHSAAAQLADESLRACRELDYKRGVILAAHFAGLLSYANGDLVTAQSLLRESLTLRNEVGDRAGIAECLEGLAGAAVRNGDGTTGGRLLGAAERIYAQLGGRRSHTEYGALEDQLDRDLALLRSATFAVARREGSAMSLEEAVESGSQSPRLP